MRKMASADIVYFTSRTFVLHITIEFGGKKFDLSPVEITTGDRGVSKVTFDC